MTVKNIHGQQAIDSREVAEMVERNHKELLRDIRKYVEIMEKSAEVSQRKIAPSDFFIESSFENRGKEYPCYLITKKGCDMIANKLTGEKGVLFTAAYVTAFEEMRQALTDPRTPALPDGVTFSSAVGFMRLTRRVMLDMGASPVDVGMMIQQTCEAISFPAPPALTKQLPGQIGLWDNPLLE